MGLDKAAGCKQNAFEIHLDVSEIYFRCNLNAFNHWPRQSSWLETKCVCKTFRCISHTFKICFKLTCTKVV